MLNHLLAILGLTVLTALWVVFQLWLKKVDPQRSDRCIGCGSGCKPNDGKRSDAQRSGGK